MSPTEIALDLVEAHGPKGNLNRSERDSLFDRIERKDDQAPLSPADMARLARLSLRQLIRMKKGNLLSEDKTMVKHLIAIKKQEKSTRKGGGGSSGDSDSSGYA